MFLPLISDPLIIGKAIFIGAVTGVGVNLMIHFMLAWMGFSELFAFFRVARMIFLANVGT